MDTRCTGLQKLHLGLVICTLIFGVCDALKITNLRVPATYVLEHNSRNPAPLILDCEYELDENEEKGFVLKWFLGEQAVYQWIPSKKPFPFNSFKQRVDTNYAVSTEHLHKHRAMAIVKPLSNFTGIYTCSVATFKSEDRKSAKLKIIVQESHFDVKYYLNKEGKVVIACKAKNIAPEPELSIFVNDNLFGTERPTSQRSDNGLYEVSIRGIISKAELDTASLVTCLLTIPDTNYNKSKSTVYYESALTAEMNPAEKLSTSLSLISLFLFLIILLQKLHVP